MSRLGQGQHAEKLLEAAAHWVVLMEERPLSEHEREQFRRWIRESESHRRAFQEAASTWGRMDILAELSELLPMETSVESSARPTLRRWTLAGAGAVLAATAAIAAVIILSPRLSEVSPVVEEIYRTRVGEKATIDLADGSTIIENTDSLLSVEYSEIARFVTLSHGEAFFEVEPDPARAFSVNAGSTTITAVGTAFSVFREGATVEVLVSEGVVEVSQADRSDIAENGAALADSPLLVRSGELAEVGPTQARVESIDTDEIARRLFWRQGLLAFEGEPLEQVIEEFSRYTNVEIRIASEEIRDIRVGGYFDSGDLAGMLTALQNNFGIEVTSTGQDQVLLSRAEQ